MENGIGQELRLSQTEDIYNVTILHYNNEMLNYDQM